MPSLHSCQPHIFQKDKYCLHNDCLLKILLCSSFKTRRQFWMLSFKQLYLELLDSATVLWRQELSHELQPHMPSINNNYCDNSLPVTYTWHLSTDAYQCLLKGINKNTVSCIITTMVIHPWKKKKNHSVGTILI